MTIRLDTQGGKICAAAHNPPNSVAKVHIFFWTSKQIAGILPKKCDLNAICVPGGDFFTICFVRTKKKMYFCAFFRWSGEDVPQSRPKSEEQ